MSDPVFSGAAETERAQQAMHSVREYLLRHGDELVLLFTPPFDKTERDPGYIKSYPPGVRENDGQYTHAAIWSGIAFAMLGDGDQAADIYAEPPHVRRGGWTWYTGAAGWFYRAGLEWVLGLQVRADQLVFNPCIPNAWRSHSVVYRHGNSRYDISVENPDAVTQGIVALELDGVSQLNTNRITLSDDGQLHKIRLLLGARP